MLRKISHIVLSILLVVSTIGLTYTKHYCSAQSLFVQPTVKQIYSHPVHVHSNMDHVKAHAHADKAHSNFQDNICTTQECSDLDNCCDYQTCNDDNCCSNEIITVRLSLNYIVYDSKETFKTFEFGLFNLAFVAEFNNLYEETAFIHKLFRIADSPHKTKNTPSILQSFRC